METRLLRGIGATGVGLDWTQLDRCTWFKRRDVRNDDAARPPRGSRRLARRLTLGRSGLWRILLQAEVRAAPMIVVHESSEMAIQTGFTEYDHVIQALPPNRANHPLNVSSLPRRPRRRQHLLDAHRLHLHDKVRPKDPIAIAQQIARRFLPGEGLAQLLSGPCRGRTRGNPKMQDAPSVMRQHQEHVQHLFSDIVSIHLKRFLEISPDWVKLATMDQHKVQTASPVPNEQGSVLSIRIPVEMWEFLDRARPQFSLPGGETLSISVVARRLLEAGAILSWPVGSPQEGRQRDFNRETYAPRDAKNSWIRRFT